MPKVLVYDKNENLLKSLNLTEEDLINKRFKRKKSILDILLDNNIQIFFGCMGGSCSACVCKVKSGEEFIDREGVGAQIFQGIAKEELLTCIATIRQNLSDSDTIELVLVI